MLLKKICFKIIGLALTIAILVSYTFAFIPACALTIENVVVNPNIISTPAGYVITISGSLNLVDGDTITVTLPSGTNFSPGFLTNASNVAFDAGGASDIPQPAAVVTELTFLAAGIITFQPSLSLTNPNYEAEIGNLWTIYLGITSGTYGTTNVPTGDVINPDTPGNCTVSIYTSKEPTPVTLTVPVLTILNISPTSGPTTGGTTVTITGIGFENGVEVTIGGETATLVEFGSAATAIIVTTPPGIVGPQDVVVTNPDGQSVTLPGAFTYIAPTPTETTTTTTSTTTTTTSTQSPTSTTILTPTPTPTETATTTTSTTTATTSTQAPTSITTFTPITTTPIQTPAPTNWGMIGGIVGGVIVIIGIIAYLAWRRGHGG